MAAERQNTQTTAELHVCVDFRACAGVDIFQVHEEQALPITNRTAFKAAYDGRFSKSGMLHCKTIAVQIIHFVFFGKWNKFRTALRAYFVRSMAERSQQISQNKKYPGRWLT